MDIDEILDMDTDDIRRSHLIVSKPLQIVFLLKLTHYSFFSQRLLSVCKRPPSDISKFISDLLDRAKTL